MAAIHVARLAGMAVPSFRLQTQRRRVPSCRGVGVAQWRGVLHDNTARCPSRKFRQHALASQANTLDSAADDRTKEAWVIELYRYGSMARTERLENPRRNFNSPLESPRATDYSAHCKLCIEEHPNHRDIKQVLVVMLLEWPQGSQAIAALAAEACEPFVHLMTLGQALEITQMLQRFGAGGKLSAQLCNRYVASTAFRGPPSTASLGAGTRLQSMASLSHCLSSLQATSFLQHFVAHAELLSLNSLSGILSALVSSNHHPSDTVYTLLSTIRLPGAPATDGAQSKEREQHLFIRGRTAARLLIALDDLGMSFYGGGEKAEAADLRPPPPPVVLAVLRHFVANHRDASALVVVRATAAVANLVGHGDTLLPVLSVMTHRVSSLAATGKLPLADACKALALLGVTRDLSTSRRTAGRRAQDATLARHAVSTLAISDALQCLLPAIFVRMEPQMPTALGKRFLPAPFEGLRHKLLKHAPRGDDAWNDWLDMQSSINLTEQIVRIWEWDEHMPKATGPLLRHMRAIGMLWTWLQVQRQWDAARRCPGGEQAFSKYAHPLQRLLHCHSVSAVQEVEQTEMVADALVPGVSFLTAPQVVELFEDMMVLNLRHPRLMSAATFAARSHLSALHPPAVTTIVRSMAALGVRDVDLVKSSVRVVHEHVKSRGGLSCSDSAHLLAAYATYKLCPPKLAQLLSNLISDAVCERDAKAPRVLTKAALSDLAWATAEFQLHCASSLSHAPGFLINVQQVLYHSSRLLRKAHTFGGDNLLKLMHYAYVLQDKQILVDTAAALERVRAQPTRTPQRPMKPLPAFQIERVAPVSFVGKGRHSRIDVWRHRRLAAPPHITLRSVCKVPPRMVSRDWVHSVHAPPLCPQRQPRAPSEAEGVGQTFHEPRPAAAPTKPTFTKVAPCFFVRPLPPQHDVAQGNPSPQARRPAPQREAMFKPREAVAQRPHFTKRFPAVAPPRLPEECAEVARPVGTEAVPAFQPPQAHAPVALEKPCFTKAAPDWALLGPQAAAEELAKPCSQEAAHEKPSSTQLPKPSFSIPPVTLPPLPSVARPPLEASDADHQMYFRKPNLGWPANHLLTPEVTGHSNAPLAADHALLSKAALNSGRVQDEFGVQLEGVGSGEGADPAPGQAVEIEIVGAHGQSAVRLNMREERVERDAGLPCRSAQGREVKGEEEGRLLVTAHVEREKGDRTHPGVGDRNDDERGHDAEHLSKLAQRKKLQARDGSSERLRQLYGIDW